MGLDIKQAWNCCTWDLRGENVLLPSTINEDLQILRTFNAEVLNALQDIRILLEDRQCLRIVFL